LNNTVNHQHGPAGEHSHSGTAFTVWLDFSQAVMQSREILNALVRKRPEYKDEFESNFTTLKNELLALDNQLFKITSKDPSKLLIASHPVYQYFARRYKLTINELMWEPDDYPSEMQWSVLTSLGNINWMIWEDQPTTRTVAKLIELGLSVIVFRPCMNVPEQGDYMSVMQANVKHFSMAYP
jgi:zinc transport system substrate-binding protein